MKKIIVKVLILCILSITIEKCLNLQTNCKLIVGYNYYTKLRNYNLLNFPSNLQVANCLHFNTMTLFIFIHLIEIAVEMENLVLFYFLLFIKGWFPKQRFRNIAVGDGTNIIIFYSWNFQGKKNYL